MSLPDLIEIVPLDKPVKADITVPGSKSITNRALILAALAEGETTLEGALWSEDTQVMVECLQELGFMVNVAPDANEPCNRAITVYGKGGVVPPGGTEAQPLELFVGNAGTAARFLAAFVCLGKGSYRLHGVPRMHERPQAELFSALRQLGFEVESESRNEKLPARIKAPGPIDFPVRFDASTGKPVSTWARQCSVSIEKSSQFASALLLCAKAGAWKIDIQGENAEESPYVLMTSSMVEEFSKSAGNFQIEPDASSGSYFLAAGDLLPHSEETLEYSTEFGMNASTTCFSNVRVANWPNSGWQIDQNFDGGLILMGIFREMLELKQSLKVSTQAGLAKAALQQKTRPSAVVSRRKDLGDSIMTAIVIAPFADRPIHFTDLGRLRLQECERVSALRAELTKCGAKVTEEGDTLTVHPSALHGAEIETYDDHRMAMCFAILGLKVPGIKIKNPACVKKTFPNFFQKLATPPPRGLGATIREGKTGRGLTPEELFAE
jgi:3-phosphoshikimate 1-carboxyvinyltransferase